MTEENPYVAKSLSHSSMPKRARWLRRFAVLNGFLIAVPLAIVGMLYLALTWDTPKASWQLSGSSGSLGLDTVIVLSAYFVVPNLVLSSSFSGLGARKIGHEFGEIVTGTNTMDS